MCIFHKWTAWESKDVIFHFEFIPLLFGDYIPLPKKSAIHGHSEARECVKCGKVQKKDSIPWD